MLGRPGLDACHDEANVEALGGGLDPSAGAAVSSVLRFSLIVGFENSGAIAISRWAAAYH
jgi:hypothetical protein